MSRRGNEMVEKDKGTVNAVPEGQKEFTTKAEYHRWLVTQNNWHAAQQMREQTKTGLEFIKERQQTHLRKGLSRQQAAAIQMKKASESVEAHRESNLTLGRSVYEEVAKWRQGASDHKETVATTKRAMRDATRAANKTGESVAQLNASKKAFAKKTKEDDITKEKARKELMESYLQRSRSMADKVRSETSDKIIDGAKRHFFEQRLKMATDTKLDAERRTKGRNERGAEFHSKQQQRRAKAKKVRADSGKSRAALLTARAEQGVAFREEKRRLAELSRQRKGEEYQERAMQVKGVQANIRMGDVDPARGAGMEATSMYYSITNIRSTNGSPTPSREVSQVS